MSTSQKPIRSASRHDDYVEDHPAFGVIGASRVSATPGARLFGTDFRHRGYVTIRIAEARRTRGLSSDHVNSAGKQTLIEVALSEAQWATFVSSMNIGDGTPCTLARVGGAEVPTIDDDTDRLAQFSGEVADHVAEVIAELEALRDEQKTAKGRRRVGMAIQNIQRNMPFVADQFDRHAERTVESAKVEVAGYVAGALRRAGLSALVGGPPPISLGTEEGE